MSSIFIGAFATLALFAVAIPLTLYYAWAATIMWGWFIAPTFANAPNLTVTQMWGICLFLMVLRPRLNTQKPDPSEFWNHFGAAILGPFMTLAMGYAVRFWWM